MDIPINNDDKCTICLENLNDTVNTKLNCNHIFCINCIKKLINNHDSNKEIKCPLCRIDIKYFTENNMVNNILYLKNNRLVQIRNNICINNIPLLLFTLIIFGMNICTSIDNENLNQKNLYLHSLLENCTKYLYT